MNLQNLNQAAERSGLSIQLLSEIVSLAELSNIKQVVLFGSRARGDYSRASDIDLAVRGGDVTSFALDVEEKTATLLTYDVIDLETDIQTELLEAIAGEGLVIYEKI